MQLPPVSSVPQHVARPRFAPGRDPFEAILAGLAVGPLAVNPAPAIPTVESQSPPDGIEGAGPTARQIAKPRISLQVTSQATKFASPEPVATPIMSAGMSSNPMTNLKGVVVPATRLTDIIMDHLAAAVSSGPITLQVRLDAESVGVMDVRLTATPGGMSARITVHDARTLGELATILPDVIERLRGAGVNVQMTAPMHGWPRFARRSRMEAEA